MLCYETREHMGTYVSGDEGGRMHTGLNPYTPCTMLTVFTGILTDHTLSTRATPACTMVPVAIYQLL